MIKRPPLESVRPLHLSGGMSGRLGKPKAAFALIRDGDEFPFRQRLARVFFGGILNGLPAELYLRAAAARARRQFGVGIGHDQLFGVGKSRSVNAITSDLRCQRGTPA